MKGKVIVIAVLWSIIGFILSDMAKAENKIYQRYIIKVRILKPLPAFIATNLAEIQTSLGKLKNVSEKINANNPGRSVENTDSFTVDNNTVYLGIVASFAIPDPLPKAYTDEQLKFEAFLTALSNNAMTDSENYKKVITRHICNNGVMPSVACSGAINF